MSRTALTARKTNAEEAAPAVAPARGAPADHDGMAERAPTSASGSAATSALKAAMTTAVAVMAVAQAVVDGSVA
jgi:hypothetical protein